MNPSCMPNIAFVILTNSQLILSSSAILLHYKVMALLFYLVSPTLKKEFTTLTSRNTAFIRTIRKLVVMLQLHLYMQLVRNKASQLHCSIAISP